MSVYEELDQIYNAVYLKWEETSVEPGCEGRYWQGKKDGLRIAMALIATEDAARRNMVNLQLTSRRSHLTEEEWSVLERLRDDMI